MTNLEDLGNLVGLGVVWALIYVRYLWGLEYLEDLWDLAILVSILFFYIFDICEIWDKYLIGYNYAFREGLKKHDFYPHFVDQGFTPLAMSTDFIIILQNINYYSHCWTPPLSHILNFFKFILKYFGCMYLNFVFRFGY